MCEVDKFYIFKSLWTIWEYFAGTMDFPKNIGIIRRFSLTLHKYKL